MGMNKTIYHLEMPVALTSIQYGEQANRKTGGNFLAVIGRHPIERHPEHTAATYNKPTVKIPIVPNNPKMSPAELFKEAHKKRMVLTMTVRILEDDEPDVGIGEAICGDWI